MKYYFNIANINICIDSPIKINWNQYIKKFLYEETSTYDEFYQIRIVNFLEPEGKIIYKDHNQIIFDCYGYEERLHFFLGHKKPCMLYKEYDDKKILFLNNDYLSIFTGENNYCIFNALAFEKILIKYNAIVLHCSYIIHNNKAILFTAPSGTGKSTQAELWKKHRNAEIINGDRAIIKKINNTYYAMGMPICGSSDICVNKSAPIETIVYLGQSADNSINIIDKKNQIKKLISETTINFFNTDFLNKAIDIISDLSEIVNMFELLCTKDENAVNCLERTLEK